MKLRTGAGGGGGGVDKMAEFAKKFGTPPLEGSRTFTFGSGVGTRGEGGGTKIRGAGTGIGAVAGLANEKGNEEIGGSLAFSMSTGWTAGV